MNKVAVVTNYSFDQDVEVILFSSVKKACIYLQEIYEEELRIDIEENGYIAEGYLDPSGMYASIVTFHKDHQNKTEFHVADAYPFLAKGIYQKGRT